MHHIGPLPDPVTLAAYSKIDPTLTKVIVDRMMAEQKHRHEIEKGSLELHREYMRSDFRQQRLALWLATGICTMFGAIALVLGLMGNTTAASIIGGASLVGIVGCFLKSKPRLTDPDDQSAGEAGDED